MADAIPMRPGPITVRDVANPTADDVHVPTIDARLATIRRFGGNPNALTVQQHCRLVAYLAVADGQPRSVALAIEGEM